jgi:hypothetical protein
MCSSVVEHLPSKFKALGSMGCVKHMLNVFKCQFNKGGDFCVLFFSVSLWKSD